MKVVQDKSTSAQVSILSPIPFLKPKAPEDTTQHSGDAMAHEVRYNSQDPNSQTYKIYLEPFDSGTPEEWLEFQAKIKLIWNGNGLTTGLAQYNLACSLLKGDALRVFNAKATDLGPETVPHMTQCLQAVTLHVFPSQSLRRQKRYMRRHVWLMRDLSL